MSGARFQQDLDSVADQLEGLSEQLGDLAMSALRDALEDPDGDGRRPEIEKRISWARRAVEKAAHTLRGEASSTVL